MIRRPVARVGRPGLIGTTTPTAVVAGTATAVSSRVANRRQQRAADQYAAPPLEAPEPAPSTPSAPTGASIPEQLQHLADLQAQGLITPEEFAAAKQRILGV